MAHRVKSAKRTASSLAPQQPVAPAQPVADLLAVDVQLRIELLHIKPMVWRRVIVPETLTLARLHRVLQVALGWSNSHLHEYEIARQRYGRSNPESFDSEPVRDERRYRLAKFVEQRVRSLVYLYDFGDGWEHRVVLEDVVAPPKTGQRIRCIAGENACPPEDVGGPPGYEEFLRVIADPQHEQHEDRLLWIGYLFDPTQVDLKTVNKQLAKIKP
jgi:hypothetical protein